jgi:hypothetical protein
MEKNLSRGMFSLINDIILYKITLKRFCQGSRKTIFVVLKFSRGATCSISFLSPSRSQRSYPSTPDSGQ